MKPFFRHLLVPVSLLLAWVVGTYACGDQYGNPISKECKELCRAGTACVEGQEVDITDCHIYCGIEQWNYFCLNCRLLPTCEDMLPCIYEHCDMRPTTTQCENICGRAAECLDEYVDQDACTWNCSTNKNMFECLNCVELDNCSQFSSCVESHCIHDWLQ